MSGPYVAAIDQGTTSSRCIIFDADGAIASVGQKEHRQIFPRSGWVEHDAAEIWINVQAVTAEALANLGLKATQLAAVGITNPVSYTHLCAGDRSRQRPFPHRS